MMRKYHVRFGGGPMEKGRLDRYLASGLPYLAPSDYEAWLDPELREPGLVSVLLRPYPARGMTGYPVGPRVNSPRNDGPDCIQPAPPEPGLFPPPDAGPWAFRRGPASDALADQARHPGAARHDLVVVRRRLAQRVRALHPPRSSATASPPHAPGPGHCGGDSCL